MTPDLYGIELSLFINYRNIVHLRRCPSSNKLSNNDICLRTDAKDVLALAGHRSRRLAPQLVNASRNPIAVFKVQPPR